ncbi:MAG: hypothetical protein K8R79_10320 [Calditrichales bacterium]|nr:hypothetical protein [Calditrichales bacterium]
MNSTKEKMETVVDYIISKDDMRARAELQKIIREDKRYVSYREQLKRFGMDLKTVQVDEKVYDDLSGVLKDFPVPAKLKIIDNLYLRISNNNL